MWIAGITRGHNASTCLTKDGEIIFFIEEERLSRKKYDGGPLAGINKILQYTDKLDFLTVAHTQSLNETAGKIDYTGDDLYTGLARKLRLIDNYDTPQHPQIVDYSLHHHKLHAACAFYRSGFTTAAAVVVDGAGTFTPMNINGKAEMTWELESIFSCSYPNNFITHYKKMGGNGPWPSANVKKIINNNIQKDIPYEIIVDENAGITKAYEAVTHYCGWSFIEAGKTMGLAPYGKKNVNIPQLFLKENCNWSSANRSVIIPTYPNGALVNESKYQFLKTPENIKDLSQLQNRRDLAYAIQQQSQQEVLELILKAVDITGEKNIVISGGYGLNCCANYWYLDKLKEKGINLYVEPISNDAGTSIGAALLKYYEENNITKTRSKEKTLYYGFDYNYKKSFIEHTINCFKCEGKENSYEDIVKLLLDKKIIAIYQGKSENGPRALGNRSILFNPCYTDGKEYVNKIKGREYFRPFAASVLQECASGWFDMKTLDSSPFMMYAVNTKKDKKDLIPSVIHIDGTCRIQTVTEEQNYHYYNLIKAFYDKTGIPLLFNTSFNLAGEPLVETLEDALTTLTKSNIDFLFLPEFNLLVNKKPISASSHKKIKQVLQNASKSL